MDWAPGRSGPAHAGELQPLGEDGLAGGLCDAAADGQPLAPKFSVLQELGPLAEIVVGLLK